MKELNPGTLLLGALLAGAVVCPTFAVAADNPGSLQGRITQITAKSVIVDRVHIFKLDLAKAKCFDIGGRPITCETLVGIGYADKARVTVLADTVQRIDILELQQ